MKGYLYDCSKCNKSFSRKWNAERHNERMHDDLSAIRYKKTKPAFEPKLKTKNPYQNDKPNLFQSFDAAFKDDDPGKSFSSYVNLAPDNLKIMKILGQLSQPFEELEKLVDDNIEELKTEEKEKLKTDIICRIFFPCMRSYRPVKSMKETVEIYRSTKVMKNIEEYFAKSKHFTY